MKARPFILVFLLLAIFGFAEERISFIDTHTHIMVMGQDPVSTALETMNNFDVRKSILMPMPFSPNNPHTFDYPEIAPLAKRYPDRFAFMGGGGTLNPMIQSTAPNQVTENVRQTFKKTAEEILQSGAVGFGEMAAEHFSFHAQHPYEYAPPDHPLFLLLADIAAEHNVPIDIHMEAVTEAMSLPPHFQSPPNPETVHENIAEFERLLDHNPKARIVWAHAGWDNTGERTVFLMRRLLSAHPNLYMNIKIDPQSLPMTRPLDETGRIKSEWIDLIRSFPDRFTLGSDEFYGMSGGMGRGMRQRGMGGMMGGQGGMGGGMMGQGNMGGVGIQRSKGPRIFLDQLPPDLARKVGYENAIHIYNL